MRRHRPFLLALLAIVALAPACGSGGGTTTVTGSIALSITPTSATIQQGGSTQVTGMVTRASFTGDVIITVTGQPTGVTGTLTLAPVNGGSTAQVTISATSATAVGTYTLTVVASGSGVSNANATFTLTVTAATPASYTMTLGTPSQSIAQGGTAPSTLTFVRTAFTGNIALTAENLPTGVTATFATNPVPGSSSSVTFTASATAAPGTFNAILIRGTSPGLTDVTASVTLVVTVTGGFAILPGATNLNVVQGNIVTTSVNATRTGAFAGTLVYTVTGPSNASLPAGLTAAVTPTGTADQNTLTVTTTAGLAAGTYPIVVHAISFGVEVTASVNVVVGAAGSAVHLDFSQCSATNMPIWLAFQDGSGAFTHVTGAGNVYTFTITSSKGAVATVTQNGTQFSTSVLYLSQAELAAFSGGCAVTTTGKTISGSVTGISGVNNPEIALGGATAFTLVSSPNFTLTNVAAGVQDLVAYNRSGQFALSGSDAVLFRRDLNLATGGTVTPVLNFATEGVPVATSTVNVSGGAVNSYFYTMNYLSGASCTSNQINFNTGSVAAPFLAYGVPASLQRATDFHNMVLQQINTQVDLRTVSTSFNLLANKVIAIGAGTGAITTTVLAGTYERLQAQFTLASDYNTASLSYSMNGSSLNRFFINQSAAYLGAVTTVTLTPADLTTVSGYLVTWGPSTTGSLQYTVTASSATPATMCSEGATLRTASSGVGGS
jgi:hypothetical protein